jgi:hypothetical protein
MTPPSAEASAGATAGAACARASERVPLMAPPFPIFPGVWRSAGIGKPEGDVR